MTKERKLAIQMWEGIHYMLSASDGFKLFSHRAITKYKRDFCEMHTLHWRNNCWFCQYIPDCHKCPLKSCRSTSRYSSYYDNVRDDRLNKSVRIGACDAIIKALGGKVND